MKPKKLYRSRKDKIFGGVCAGIAKHLDQDPTVVRILWIAITLLFGFGLLLYLLCWLVIPKEPE